MQLKYLSFFILPLIAFGADIAPPTSDAAPEDPVPVQPKEPVQAVPEEATNPEKEEKTKIVEQTKCRNGKGITTSEPGISVLKRDVNINLPITGLTCKPEKIVTATIVAHGSTSCAILNKVDGEISLIVNGNENKGNGTFTIDAYGVGFKGFINSGSEAGRKIELKGRVTDLLLGRGAHCISSAGLGKINVAINSLQF